MNSNRKGDFAEYYAVTWLWDNGYEVFKNLETFAIFVDFPEASIPSNIMTGYLYIAPY